MGHVYVLTNSNMPDLVKIGATDNSDVNVRIRQHQQTLPGKSTLIHHVQLESPFMVERACIERLKDLAADGTKEWFHAPVNHVIRIVDHVANEISRDELLKREREADYILKSRKPQRVNTVEEIGAITRAMRKHLGLTQQQFADLAGTGRRFVSEVEAGKTTIQMDCLLKVLQGFGIDILLSPRMSLEERLDSANFAEK